MNETLHLIHTNQPIKVAPKIDLSKAKEVKFK